MRRFGTVVVIVLVIALVGFFGLRLARGSGKAAAPQVAYAAAHYGNLFVNVTGNGTVQAATSLNVSAQQNGTITSVPVHLGEQVSNGQLLATVSDNGSLQTQLLQAQAQLTSDEASLTSLVSPTPPTAAQISAQQEKVQADTQRIASDQQAIQNLTVTAPFSGVIATMNVSQGQSVGAGTSLFEIVNPSDVEIDASFPSINLQNAFVGEGAQATVAGIGTLNTTVKSIGLISDGSGKTGPLYPVTLSVQSPPGGLRAGMPVTVSIPNAYTYAQGTIAFPQTENITAQTSGTVASIDQALGSSVSNGATVLTISAPSLTTQLTSDESALSSDENTLSQLQHPTPPSQSQVTSDKARIAVDRQSVANAQQALSQLNVTSPISGILTAVNAQVGESTSSAGSSSSSSSTSVSSALFAVENPNTLQVAVPIDELSIAQVKVGQRAIVTANALPGQEFPGTVAVIAPAGVNSSGVANFSVTISVANPGKLLAGMSANVSIQVAQVQHALLIPVEAVTGSGTHAIVRVHTSKGDRLQQVSVGLSNDVSAQVLSGLSAGQQVVTATVSSSTSGGLGFGGGGGGFQRKVGGAGGGGTGGSGTGGGGGAGGN